MEHFNKLDPARAERLAILMEEMAEASQVIGKILRHGFHSYHPVSKESNKDLLEKEMGHVENAILMLVEAGDLRVGEMMAATKAKRESIKRYLHHQEVGRG